MHTRLVRCLGYAVSLLLTLLCAPGLQAQELHARVIINHQKVQGTSNTVFDNLQTTLTEFINTQAWTQQHYALNERINCTFNITVNKYDAASNEFTATLLVQSVRPVYNASYTTTTWSFQDNRFDFVYKEYDPLTFRIDQIDNNLTALIAYYAYLIIGMDMDTMAPLGGSEVLQAALTVVNGAQNLSGKGWKAFDDSKNRYAIINDYLDGALRPMREMQYSYYRKGLDEMATNVERGRAEVFAALKLLQQAKHNKPLSMMPQIFAEFKGEELAAIFAGKGPIKEREEIKEILSEINPSQNNVWEKIK